MALSVPVEHELHGRNRVQVGPLMTWVGAHLNRLEWLRSKSAQKLARTVEAELDWREPSMAFYCDMEHYGLAVDVFVECAKTDADTWLCHVLDGAGDVWLEVRRS